ncbi:ArnT family glycosyltransferase [Nanoarchaeota archaeon]
MKKKSLEFLKNHAIFLLILALFLIVKLSLYRISHLEWDEAVYLGMAKYLYTSAKMGFFEILRPIMLPLFIGIFWKLGLGIMVAAKILAVSISLASISIVYFLSKKIFDKKTALIAALMLALSPVFLEHSFRIMPLLWSVFFGLFALYQLKEKRYVLSGLLTGIAFLFRFTQGAMIVAVGLAFIIQLFDKKQIKSFIQKSLKYYLSFALAVLPYLIFNYMKYGGEVSKWRHAVFRPFIYASGTIAISGGQNNPLFFITNLIIQNYLALFIIAAAILFFTKKLYKDETYSALFAVFLILLIYFSRLDHQELRYMLDFFLYAVILAAYGLYSSISYLTKKAKLNTKHAKYLITALFILLFIFCFISRTHKTGLDGGVFKEMLNNVDGTVLSTTPFASVAVDE